MNNILEIKNLSKDFPGVKALENINLNVKRGEVHGLVGENGAGKSTLMKILTGVHLATVGTVSLEGKNVSFSSPKEAQKSGLSIIHQEFSLVPFLNSIDNIFLGHELTTFPKFLSKQKMRGIADNLLKQLNADVDLNKPVKELSIAEQQFVEISKAIAVETKVLIFDEPTASLTNEEVNDLFKLIESFKNEGVTIIYISHHLDEIFEICDRFSCLRDGKMVDTKSVKDVTRQDIIKMMVGREITNVFPERPSFNKDKNEIVLDVKKLNNEFVSNITFDLRRGEILGIAGLVGAGRTEVVRALIGADNADKKEVNVNGKKASIKHPTDALSYGICLIPENRKSQGLVLDMTIKNNISLPILKKLSKSLGLLNKKKEEEIVNQSIKDLSIKTPGNRQLVKNLSGGNQQKIVLAKWLNTSCNILIFDEPTRGIDVGAKEEIYKLIRKLADNGISVIMISSELPEITEMSDRVLVMHKRKMSTVLNSEEATSEEIMYYATGGEKK